jgi:glycosyltransferase involved in cell wall biosynthesis
MPKSWICCQVGAREHYVVPRVLHRSGRLAALYTDYWAEAGIRSLASAVNSGMLNSLATRFHSQLGMARNGVNPDGSSSQGPQGREKAEIISWNFSTLLQEASFRRKMKQDGGELYRAFIKIGRSFSIRVRESLKRRPDLGSHSVFFSYDTGALEALEWCKDRGIKSVLNQMDPNRVEVGLVRAEEQQWPGWALSPIQVPEEYFVRREQEWAAADRVLVNSDFSRQALIRQGVPPKKLVVVPLCYEAEVPNANSKVESPKPNQPLRVLFLGQVILRKGIQYLIAAARQLEQENIHFDVVGPVGISREAVATAPGNMTFHGRAGRDQAADWYRRSHLFVLPTISDGFAITQLEAMAYGLPVISTPCCGDVVTDGVDGFIVQSRNAGALAQTFKRYLERPDLLASQAAAALVKVKKFTLDRLGEDLASLESSLG